MHQTPNNQIFRSQVIQQKDPLAISNPNFHSEIHVKTTLLDFVRSKFLYDQPDLIKSMSDSLKYVKSCIDTEFAQFSSRLINLAKHYHLLKFSLKTSEDMTKVLNGTEEDEHLLQRMKEYPLKVHEFDEALENCRYQMSKAFDKLSFLNYREFCPTGKTLVDRYEQVIDKYFTIDKHKEEIVKENVAEVFELTSPNFSDSQYRSIETLLASTGHKLKHVNLIYRASEHGFRSKNFKEVCSKMQKTLVVVKSTQKKLFGGYTPCKWLDTKEKQYVADTKKQSFLFSVDENMVFPIRPHQTQYAISTYGSWGPIFGSPYGPDLSISDQCHLNQHSCSSLGSHYEIPLSIKEFSNEAFSLLAGSKKFRVLEYEVFEVEFESS